jgi:hypothetical protein
LFFASQKELVTKAMGVIGLRVRGFNGFKGNKKDSLVPFSFAKGWVVGMDILGS